MKSFSIIITFLFSSWLSFAQQPEATPVIPVDESTKLITYKEVVQEKGTRDELYNRGIEWINAFFKNPVDVTRTRDKDNGLIKGIARFKLFYADKDGFKRETGMCEYEFTLEFKEGRYRVIFTNFILKEVSRRPIERWLNKLDPAYNPQWDDYLKQVDTYVKETTANLKKAMQPPVKKDDSW
ncbi:MAG: DUF4468 domain-containing protein [Bacteroidetes bacterium]|nr:DUF4468 domain-containing protein [Bacteroidota bacterium]